MDQIAVCVRVRPLQANEEASCCKYDNQSIAFETSQSSNGSHLFTFDHVFGGHQSNQEIFETVLKDVVTSAVHGYNGTIFAYGQTSSGKTFTMTGIRTQPGVISLAAEHVFATANEQLSERDFFFRVQYFEIYNEVINDLLDSTQVGLQLRQSENGMIQVVGATERICTSASDVNAVVAAGQSNRSIGATMMNEKSSRSHTIFRMVIESREKQQQDNGVYRISNLCLVDLAGAECAHKSGANGLRLTEGGYINRSLLTLSTVIQRISSGQSGHIPFRDSKLTRILESAIGGNSKTAIICNITPAAQHQSESISTLKFASGAKRIKNKPILNDVVVLGSSKGGDEPLLKKYRDEIKELKKMQENMATQYRDFSKEQQEIHEMRVVLCEKIARYERMIVCGQQDMIKTHRDMPVPVPSSSSPFSKNGVRNALFLSLLSSRDDNDSSSSSVGNNGNNSNSNGQSEMVSVQQSFSLLRNGLEDLKVAIESKVCILKNQLQTVNVAKLKKLESSTLHRNQDQQLVFLSDMVTSLGEDNVVLNAFLQSAIDDLMSHQSDFEQLIQFFQKLEADAYDKLTCVDRMQKSLSQAKEAIEKKDAHIQLLNTRISELEQEKKNDNTLELLEEQMVDFAMEIKSRDEEIERLKREIATFQQKTVVLKEEEDTNDGTAAAAAVASSSSTTKKVRRNHADVQQISTLTLKIAELQQENEQLLIKLSSNAPTPAASPLEEENKKLREKIELQKQSTKKIRQQASAKIAALEEKVKFMLGQVQNLVKVDKVPEEYEKKAQELASAKYCEYLDTSGAERDDWVAQLIADYEDQLAVFKYEFISELEAISNAK